jgi:hypothetical protein|tara:strand:+ start:70 stop:312 length:243 start_codon:yes stop_codon:yes gene_type:complete
MTEKFLYVVDHYIPFPSSEYGGLWNVVAQNDEECFDLITEKDKGDYNEMYYSNLRENINKSRIFELSGSHESYVVEEFTT